MFNISKSLININLYSKSYPFFLQLICQSIGTLAVLEIVRQQLPEIKLLQLIPGYYFFLLFIFVSIFFLFSSVINLYPILLDYKNILGTKNNTKNKYFIYNKFLYFFAFLTFNIGINLIIPGQFDNFYNYTEKNLENIWSFNELISIEAILLLILLCISQLPLISFYTLNNKIKILALPNSFKSFIFIVLILSGFLTPTVDALSQLIFSVFTIFLFLISIHFLIKRIQFKYLCLATLD